MSSLHTSRSFAIKSLYGWENNIYHHAKNKTLDALEANKQVIFQIVDPTNYGGHIRAVVDGLPVHLTKKQIRWSTLPHYLFPTHISEKPMKMGSHNVPVID